jgi:ElaA protein
MIRSAPTRELDLDTLYAILRLRAEVFVVEQNCAYLDLDGRDLEPDAIQVWIERPDGVVGALRILAESDGSRRIGRVAVAERARGERLGDDLMVEALRLAAGARVLLDAQTYLVPWYERLGFGRAGADFVEDGIPHTPMHHH